MAASLFSGLLTHRAEFSLKATRNQKKGEREINGFLSTFLHTPPTYHSVSRWLHNFTAGDSSTFYFYFCPKQHMLLPGLGLLPTFGHCWVEISKDFLPCLNDLWIGSHHGSDDRPLFSAVASPSHGPTGCHAQPVCSTVGPQRAGSSGLQALSTMAPSTMCSPESPVKPPPLFHPH